MMMMMMMMMMMVCGVDDCGGKEGVVVDPIEAWLRLIDRCTIRILRLPLHFCGGGGDGCL